ncbi:MAG: hypothetical protein A2902_00020 [Elusimicrobia bacterium RIFCSPLOWO2_01_FULL_64_13]|nr:MAG: hypothetical protein A2902_00020 [Elusimicrobia bacterium RIFCSPLOWO2_01_FULL_64_13]
MTRKFRSLAKLAACLAIGQVLMPAFTSSLSAGSRDNLATSGAQFLKLGVNARAIAMGEAYSSVADGSDGLYWNPASLARVEGKSLSLMHAVYFQSIFYDYASYAHQLGSLGTFGLGVQYLNAGAIDETDEFGNNAGSFRPQDLAVTFGWAREIREWDSDVPFLFGVSGKFIRSRIIETASTGAFDVGLSYKPVARLRLGLAGQNLGPKLKFKNESDSLPMNIKLGSSYEATPFWTIAADLNVPRDNDLNAAFGTEYRLSAGGESQIAGRLGYQTRSAADLSDGISSVSAGVGYGWGPYDVDFAWAPFGDLGNTYRISFSGKF